MLKLLKSQPNQQSGQQTNHQSIDLLIEHKPLLFTIAMRLTNNKENSEDLLQDLAVKIQHQIQHQPSHLINAQNPKAYLVKTLNNLYIDQWRSLKNKVHYQSQSLDDYDCDANQDSHPAISVEQQVSQQQLATTVEQALATIPEPLRIVVSLFDIEGYSLQEIAEIIDVPIGTIKSRLHRARNNLRQSLAMQSFNDNQ